MPNIPTAVSIYRAIRKSQEYLLKRYLSNNSYLINVPGPNGITPLGNAVMYGNKDIVDLLITEKANINLACPITKRTPLHVCQSKLIITKMISKHKETFSAGYVAWKCCNW